MAGRMRVGSYSWGLMVLLVLAVVSEWELEMVNGAISVAECNEKKELLIKACKPVIYRLPTSAECCRLMREAQGYQDCVCPAISPNLANIIGNTRAINILKGCGIRVPPNAHCGAVHNP